MCALTLSIQQRALQFVPYKNGAIVGRAAGKYQERGGGTPPGGGEMEGGGAASEKVNNRQKA